MDTLKNVQMSGLDLFPDSVQVGGGAQQRLQNRNTTVPSLAHLHLPSPERARLSVSQFHVFNVTHWVRLHDDFSFGMI